MTATTTGSDAVFDDYLCTCSVCGNPAKSSEIQVRDGIAICYRHPNFRTKRELDKINARTKPTIIRPLRNARPFAPMPTYLEAESQIFDLVTSVAPFETRDVTSDGAGGVTGNKSWTATGWAILYLLAVYNEGKRPAAWRAQALAKAKTLADFVFTLQWGQPGGSGGGLTKEAFEMWGGVSASPGLPGAFTFLASEQGLLCVAMCRLFVATGIEHYRTAAAAFANPIVNLMAVDLKASGGLATFYGPPSGSYNGNDGTYDMFFAPADLTALWGLVELKAIAGDFLVGPVGTVFGFFNASPQRLLSTAIAQIRAFWSNGTLDANTGTVVNGLSAATPFEEYDAGDGVWVTANPSGFTPANWAAGLRSLFEVEGLSSQVTSCWDYLLTFGSNASFETSASASDAAIQRGQTGTYDATVAPATRFDTVNKVNATAFYDFAAAGLLAPISATRGAAALAALKETLAIPQPRTVEGTPRDGRHEHLQRLGRSGLSFQPWTTSTARQESVTRAAQVGFLYRYGQVYGGRE